MEHMTKEGVDHPDTACLYFLNIGILAYFRNIYILTCNRAT